jgi:hypothetical protein
MQPNSLFATNCSASAIASSFAFAAFAFASWCLRYRVRCNQARTFDCMRTAELSVFASFARWARPAVCMSNTARSRREYCERSVSPRARACSKTAASFCLRYLKVRKIEVQRKRQTAVVKIQVQEADSS